MSFLQGIFYRSNLPKCKKLWRRLHVLFAFQKAIFMKLQVARKETRSAFTGEKAPFAGYPNANPSDESTNEAFLGKIKSRL